MKALIIPDTHLRGFWKETVEKWDGPIIFLGDYLDPYPYEWKDEYPNSIQYLLDILNFKDQNPDRVTLLLGNHKLSNFLGNH